MDIKFTSKVDYFVVSWIDYPLPLTSSPQINPPSLFSSAADNRAKRDHV